MQESLAQLPDPETASGSNGSSSGSSSSDATLSAPALCRTLTKPLLRRFDDASEKCREMAAGCALKLLRSCPDEVLGLLPYIMPVLEERLQRQVRSMQLKCRAMNASHGQSM